jgi:hypothetical protein
MKKIKINKFGIMFFFVYKAIIANYGGLYLRLQNNEIPSELDSFRFYELYNKGEFEKC